MTQPYDWQTALEEWLKNNPPTMPDELVELHREFLRRFPRERLGELTLEEYALGHDNYKDSFCYWLEWETVQLGSVRGGTSAKWGIWWRDQENVWAINKVFPQDDPQQALQQIKDGLVALTDAAAAEQYQQLDEIGEKQLGRNRNSLRAKTLHLYFPEHFLPIANPSHLANILRYFGQKPVKGLHARNRQLLAYLRSQPEFADFDTVQMMRFLYAYDLHEQPVIFRKPDVLVEAIEGFARFARTARYQRDEYDYKRDLLHVLHEALSNITEAEAADMVGKLTAWVSSYRKEIDNLTSWQNRDVFERYLTAVPADQTHLQLQALLDEDGDLQERINSFREGFESDYQVYVDEPGRLGLGFISLLLMGADMETHIIYRAMVIRKACKDWGVEDFTTGKRNDGDKYTHLQALVPPLQARLTKAIDRKADLIDVHSLLWFNYSDEYDVFKRAEEGQKDHKFMRELLRIVERTRNIILYGPPGTGKTYWVEQYRRRLPAQQTFFVTFHQSYAYEEFVEGLKPSSVDGQIRYHVMPGIFRQVCAAAAADPDNEYLLVVDEINRANIAKVFGELITLIEDDKRLGATNEIRLKLPYSGAEFSVPANLTILGTMNTADRSIALLDIALRRRFTFIPVMPNPTLLEAQHIQDVDLPRLLRSLNERITRLLDQDHQIGHSYFINVTNLADLRFVWKHRILPLLQEYFYNDGERLQAVLGERFVVLQPTDGETEWSDRYAPESNQYRLPELTDEVFITALRELSGQKDDQVS
jgi:hypothetical protein